MALAPYTSYAEVRAAIGVSSTDIADETLDLPIYSVTIQEALRTVSPTLPADLKATMAIPEPRSDEEQRLVDLGGLFATYTIAAALCTSAPLFALKEMKDDRTADTRVDDPFKNLRDGIDKMLDYVQAKLEEAYLEVFPGAQLTGYTDVEPGQAAGLALDPVTG